MAVEDALEEGEVQRHDEVAKNGHVVNGVNGGKEDGEQAEETGDGEDDAEKEAEAEPKPEREEDVHKEENLKAEAAEEAEEEEAEEKAEGEKEAEDEENVKAEGEEEADAEEEEVEAEEEEEADEEVEAEEVAGEQELEADDEEDFEAENPSQEAGYGDEEEWADEQPPEQKKGSKGGGRGKANGHTEVWPSLPARPAPRRWTGRPQGGSAAPQDAPVPKVRKERDEIEMDEDVLSQLRHLEDENEDLQKELSNERQRVKQLQKLQVEAAQANHREFEAKKREAAALRDLEEAKAYVSRRHTFALNEKAELLQQITDLKRQLQESKDREVALNLEAQEANEARADVRVEQEDFKKEAEHWRKDAAEQAVRVKSAEQRLQQLEQRKLDDKAKIKALAEQLQAAVDAGFSAASCTAPHEPQARPKAAKHSKAEPKVDQPVVKPNGKHLPSDISLPGEEVRISWSLGWLFRRAEPAPGRLKAAKAKSKGKKVEKPGKAAKTTSDSLTDQDEAEHQKTQHAILLVLVLLVVFNMAWASWWRAS
ncbi:unnamed protein product [Durusdinium trenchii]|uniref:Uncharacterized protein n=1 Tax=Durusdinium trenchii TaxID=1381693 RepID=A0ABP0S4B1_9DINO